MNFKYRMEVFWHKEDECYHAIVPKIEAFRLIVGSGETPEEAIKELQICIGEVLKSYEEYGWEIPKPNIYSSAS